MKKRLVKLAIAVGLVMSLSIPAGAAILHDAHQGTRCEFGIVTMHFVNNKTGGNFDESDLTILFDNETIIVSPYKVLKNVVHYKVNVKADADLDPGAFILLNANTELNGMLVLSNFKCNAKKK